MCVLRLWAGLCLPIGAAQQAHEADTLIEALIVAEFRFCSALVRGYLTAKPACGLCADRCVVA
jgi:hypothetical protein